MHHYRRPGRTTFILSTSSRGHVRFLKTDEMKKSETGHKTGHKTMHHRVGNRDVSAAVGLGRLGLHRIAWFG